MNSQSSIIWYKLTGKLYEQQRGKYFQLNSNLNVVKTSMQSPDLSRDAWTSFGSFNLFWGCLGDRRAFTSIETTWFAVLTSMGFFHCKSTCINELAQKTQKTFRSKIYTRASKRFFTQVSKTNDPFKRTIGAHRDTPIRT